MLTSSADAQGSLRIYLVPATATQRGQLYEVRLGSADGVVIVPKTLDPEHAACRYLHERGFKGRLEVWSEGRVSPRMIIRSIEKAAGLTAREDDRKGVRLRKYAPLGAAAAPPLPELPSETASNDNGEVGGEAEAG